MGEATFVNETPSGLETPRDYLFPKISGKLQEFLSHLRKLKDSATLPKTIDLEGTVKLHGMHADIVFDLKTQSSALRYPLQGITFRSRNRMCSPDESQQGWPRSIAQRASDLLVIKHQVITTFRECNPDMPIDPASPLVIAGEWIGGNVQRGVGIARLSERFVLLSVQINGIWQRDSDYKDIQMPSAGIYNIFCCGSQIVKFDTSNLTDSNLALIELQRLADTVEASCPFAHHFGISGMGEGVVWKPGFPAGRGNPKFWLKTKGPISGKENRIDLTKVAKDQGRSSVVAEAVPGWVTPRRIEQGFEYLLEMNLAPTRESLKHFIDWLTKDIMIEEKCGIEQIKKRLGEDKEVEKSLKVKIAHAARDAYLREMNASGVKLA